VRQQAWLDTAPRQDGRSGDLRPRRETLPEDAPELALAMPSAGARLLRHLGELGWCSFAEGGPRPLGYAELQAWAQLTATRLTPWEALTLRALTSAYAGSAAVAQDASCPAPWPETETVSRSQAAAFAAGLDAMCG